MQRGWGRPFFASLSQLHASTRPSTDAGSACLGFVDLLSIVVLSHDGAAGATHFPAEGVTSIPRPRSCRWRRYKRYRLSEGKDFSSLFFPEKESLLRLLRHFEDKSGETVSASAPF